MGKRFRVAFSFAGEKRKFVSEVAEILAGVFGQEAILYDKYHEAEFAVWQLGFDLPDLYNQESDLIVTLFCPTYDVKLWSGLEWDAIHEHMTDGNKKSVMLCRFELAQVKGLRKTAGFIELDGKEPEEFAQLILQRLAINEKLPRDHYLNQKAQVVNAKEGDWRIPLPTSFFTGQEDYLEVISKKLDEGKAVKIGQAVHLHGFGGVGKTALALEYALRNRDKYENGYFLKCETADTLTESLVEIGGGSMTGSPEEINGWAEQGLAHLAQASNALVILDNADILFDADKVSDLLRRTFEATRKHHLLVTARPDAVYDGLEPLPIESMSPEVGGLFFYRLWKNQHEGEWASASETDQDACKAMSDELGGLPLALEQAGVMAQRRKLRPDELVESFRKRREEIMKSTPLAHDQISLWVAVEAVLGGLGNAAKKLAFLLAFMSPEHIDERLFTEWGMTLPDVLSEALSAGEFDQVRDELLDAILCKRVNEEDPYLVIPTLRSRLEMHRAVQSVIQDMTGEAKPDWWWAGGGEAASALLNHFRYYEGLPHAEVSREARQKILGSNLVETSSELSNFAQLLKATNQMSKAEPLMRRAIEIDEKEYGINHPNVARLLNNLAQLLKETKRLDEAKPVMLRVIKILKESEPIDSQTLAVGLNNLATLLQAKNSLAEAENYLREALKTIQDKFGHNHYNTAIYLNNLAMLLRDMNKHDEAENLMRKTLEIDSMSHSPTPLYEARFLNNMGQIYLDKSNIHEATPLVRKSLLIFIRNLGLGHPSSQIVFRNYKGLLLRMENSEEKIQTELSAVLREAGVEE